VPAPSVQSQRKISEEQNGLHPELLSGKNKKSALKRSLLWALGIFTAVNIGLAQISHHDQAKNARAGGDFWTNPVLIDLAISEFKGQNPPAKVVLLGSSLMMFPFWAMDASFKHKIDDIAHYHKSVALQAALAKCGVADAPVFSLASAGQMSTDTFLYVNEFLKDKNKPQVIVWGIAPRDFSDNNVKSPTATVSFQQIVGLQNFVSYSKTFMPRFEDKAEFLANHSCFLYGRRWRLQKEVDKGLERLSRAITRVVTAGSPQSTADKVMFAPTADQAVMQNLGSTGGAAVSGDLASLLSSTAEKRWSSSAKEYAGRYKGISKRDLTVQMACLDKTLKICRDRGIKVVIINMPLTAVNQKLMAPGFYDKFSAQVKNITSRYGKDVTLVDETHDLRFKDEDYWDTVHMNHVGGAKLLTVIAPAVKQYLVKQ